MLTVKVTSVYVNQYSAFATAQGYVTRNRKRIPVVFAGEARMLADVADVLEDTGSPVECYVEQWQLFGY